VEEIVDRYLQDLETRGRRPHTLRGYRTDLRHLAAHVERSGGPLDQGTVASFLASTGDLAPASQARTWSVIRGFLRWAEDHGHLPPALTAATQATAATPEVETAASTPNPVPPPGSSRAPDTAAVEAVLAVIPRHADRDQLLYGLLARLGLRPGEALGLTFEDFDETDQSLTVTGWAGTRRRVLVDDPQILLRLTHWRNAADPRSGPMFTAPGRTTPLRYQSIAQRWARYTTTAGREVTLGDLRRAHTAALLTGGVPERIVRDRIGQPNGPLPATPDQPDADTTIRAWQTQTTTTTTATTPTPAAAGARRVGRQDRDAG
jgi:integrase